jgi:hypothetical protein
VPHCRQPQIHREFIASRFSGPYLQVQGFNILQRSFPLEITSFPRKYKGFLARKYERFLARKYERFLARKYKDSSRKYRGSLA